MDGRELLIGAAALARAGAARAVTHFAPRGIGVKWFEFAFGPPLQEAVNAGAADYGYSGDAPPAFVGLRAALGIMWLTFIVAETTALADRILLNKRGHPALGALKERILVRLPDGA